MYGIDEITILTVLTESYKMRVFFLPLSIPIFRFRIAYLVFRREW